MQTLFITQKEKETKFLSKVAETKVKCDCGESIGYVDEDYQETVIICDACHYNAPNKERYF
jgi:hypothetical protein